MGRGSARHCGLIAGSTWRLRGSSDSRLSPLKNSVGGVGRISDIPSHPKNEIIRHSDIKLKSKIVSKR